MLDGFFTITCAIMYISESDMLHGTCATHETYHTIITKKRWQIVAPDELCQGFDRLKWSKRGRHRGIRNNRLAKTLSTGQPHLHG